MGTYTRTYTWTDYDNSSTSRHAFRINNTDIILKSDGPYVSNNTVGPAPTTTGDILYKIKNITKIQITFSVDLKEEDINWDLILHKTSSNETYMLLGNTIEGDPNYTYGYNYQRHTETFIVNIDGSYLNDFDYITLSFSTNSTANFGLGGGNYTAIVEFTFNYETPIKYYVNNTWQNCIMKYYTGTGWQSIMPYRWNGSTWERV